MITAEAAEEMEMVVRAVMAAGLERKEAVEREIAKEAMGMIGIQAMAAVMGTVVGKAAGAELREAGVH